MERHAAAGEGELVKQLDFDIYPTEDHPHKHRLQCLQPHHMLIFQLNDLNVRKNSCSVIGCGQMCNSGNFQPLEEQGYS